MKPLTVHVPDDVYERAERRAADRGMTLHGEVAELIKRLSEGNGEGADAGLREPEPQEPWRNVAVTAVVGELAEVAKECGLPNWDGQGAAPVSQDTYDNARRFVEALPECYPLPSVGVEPDGHLTLEWYRDPRWTLSLSLSPDAGLYYAALFATNYVRGRELFTGKVPEIVLSLIRRVVLA
jgi:hypothetical protein